MIAPVTATLLTERRLTEPFGLDGGGNGQPGRNLLVQDGNQQPLPGSGVFELPAGARLRIETPGGGGTGS